MLGAHVSRPPPRLAEVAPDLELPPNLEEVLERGLAKISAERYASAVEFIGALDAVIAGVPLASGRPVELGLAQTANLTPLPQDQSIMMEVIPGTATPVHGVVRLPDGRLATPLPGTLHAPAATAAPTTDVERAQRAVSLADVDLPPLPRRWYVIGAIVIGAGILIAIILALATGGKKSATARGTPPVVLPVPVQMVDKDTQLKALLHDLQTGKTCADRKAVIPKLVELGDARAIEPLRKARYRMVGGVLGIGQDNANHCLKAEAEAAIKKLAR